MGTQISIAALYLLGAFVAVLLAVRAHGYRNDVAAELVGLAACIAEWSFFYALETLSNRPEYRALWSQFAYIGAYGTAPFLLRFCLKWLRPRMVGSWMLFLWVIPVAMVVAAFTNPLHGLLWTEIRPSDTISFVYYYGHGPVFWVGVAYQYLLIAASGVLIVEGLIVRKGIYRQQVMLVFLGLVIAVAGNVVYVAGVMEPMPLDITPLSLAPATALFLAGISRVQLLALLPAARHRVVELMPDGLIVLDEQMRVVDWNAAALSLWHIDQTGIMGARVVELIPGWADAVPQPPPESFTTTLEEGDESSVCHHIDMELRRFSTRSARPDGWIALFHDSTELRAAELRLQEANVRLEEVNRELVRQAIHDGLTGLFNRSYLDEALPRELARAEREGRPVGLLILDIDHFKEVNDRHGHGAGDRVLIRVSRLVRALVRAGDIPCRYGGDELVAVMPGATREEAMLVGERIRVTVAEDRAVEGADAVTVSIGVAVYPDDADSATDLFRRADRTLYRAKDSGRNRVMGATDA